MIKIVAMIVSLLVPVLCSAEPVQYIKFDPFVVDYHSYIKTQKTNTKNTKTKFYNFDDLLIDGKIKKPKVLYTDARQKVKFERLLRLKKDFLPKLVNTNKDPALR